jgi:hypothetical protein
MARVPSQSDIPLHPDAGVLAGPGRGLVLDPAGSVARQHIDPFIETYNEDAEPFAWTESKVHQRRVKGRRISEYCDSG